MQKLDNLSYLESIYQYVHPMVETEQLVALGTSENF